MGSLYKRITADGLRFLALCALGIALSGCGSEESNRSRAYNLDAYIRQSCELKPTEGEELKVVRSESPIATGYFGKEYNRDWLASVYSTSTQATIDFVRRNGVHLYRAAAMSQKSCRNFSSVEAMPYDLALHWQSIQDRMDAENDVRGTQGFMTGLYIPKNAAHPVVPVKKSNVIIIREDANRWTIVHEFMHHNFKARAVERGFDDLATQSGHLALIQRYARLKDDPSLKGKERTRTLAALFKQIVESFDRIMIQYPLEEMAIEAMLQDAVDSGKLEYVPTGSYDNAKAYIRKSKETVENYFRSTDPLFNDLVSATHENNQWDVYESLLFYPQLKEKRIGQVTELLAKRAESEKKASAPKSGAASAVIPELAAVEVAPCASATEGLRAIETVTKRLRALR
jgi:hypothetical protein